ncbi:MAG: alpha/beta hydrolase [Planctomycetes bacterium]|nr:alpha/beta hydrolase [Planctomycetota bacterium]
MARLRQCGRVVETAQGAMEFSLIGTDPVILHFHAGAAGCDQTLALSWDIQDEGFTVLTPSRPGYLRTPLSTGAAPEQAADAVASLLQLLAFDRVIVMGTSGGGPTALQFAIRHPTSAVGLILQSPAQSHG